MTDQTATSDTESGSATGGATATDPAQAATSEQGTAPATGQEDAGAAQTQDWYAPFIDGEADQDIAKEAARHADPKSALKALVETKRAFRESGRVKIPGEQASEDDIDAWNKALGRPETVDGYGDALSVEGFEFDEPDKAMLTALAEEAHTAGGVVASPETVKFMANAYAKVLQAQQAQMSEMAQQKQAEHAKALRTMWQEGHEHNLKMANAGIERFMGEGFEEIKGLTLIDESGQPHGRLGDHPVIANAMMEAMRASSEDPTFLLTNTGDGMGADAIDGEIKKIQNMRYADPNAYEKNQQRLMELMAKREKVSKAA